MCRLRIYAMRAPQIVRNACLCKQVLVFIHQDFETDHHTIQQFTILMEEGD